MEEVNTDSNRIFDESCNSIQQESSQSTDNFYIFAFQPYKRIRHIKIRPHFFISVLDIIYPNDSIFIYKGQKLDRHNSFNHYKILNEDKIVVLPFHLSKSAPDLIEKWRKESLDIESFEKKLSLQINSDCRKEMSRLRDLKFFKYELKKNKNQIDSNNFLSVLYENKKNDDIQLNIDYPKSESPSCEPLPIIWN